MYVCHLHRDIFPLCYVSTDAYFHIHVCHVHYDIMQIFHFLLRPTTCNALSSIMSGPGGMYTSPPDGSMCAYMSHVWGNTTHPTLLETEKSPSQVDDFKIGPNHVMCVIALLTPIVE